MEKILVNIIVSLIFSYGLIEAFKRGAGFKEVFFIHLICFILNVILFDRSVMFGSILLSITYFLIYVAAYLLASFLEYKIHKENISFSLCFTLFFIIEFLTIDVVVNYLGAFASYIILSFL